MVYRIKDKIYPQKINSDLAKVLIKETSYSHSFEIITTHISHMLENIKLELFIYKINTPKIISHLREFLLCQNRTKENRNLSYITFNRKTQIKVLRSN